MSEYKFLAMDEDGDCWLGSGFYWDGRMYVAYDAFDTIHKPPFFLKPGQLWERILQKLDCGQNVQNNAEVWNGYWWRLVEDHSAESGGQKQLVNFGLYEAAKTMLKCLENCPGTFNYHPAIEDNLRKALSNATPVEPQGWIVDRGPTEEDWWEDEHNRRWVMVYDGHEVIFSEYPLMDDEDVWQPVPLCLRVPPPQPEEPKCETCEHFSERDGATVCWLKLRFDPICGMAGCVYKRRKE
jgi:hypothetical protein